MASFRYVDSSYFDETGDKALTSAGVGVEQSAGGQNSYVSRAIDQQYVDATYVADSYIGDIAEAVSDLTATASVTATVIIEAEASISANASVSASAVRIKTASATIAAGTFDNTFANGGTFGNPTQEKFGPGLFVANSTVFVPSSATKGCKPRQSPRKALSE